MEYHVCLAPLTITILAQAARSRLSRACPPPLTPARHALPRICQYTGMKTLLGMALPAVVSLESVSHGLDAPTPLQIGRNIALASHATEAENRVGALAPGPGLKEGDTKS